MPYSAPTTLRDSAAERWHASSSTGSEAPSSVVGTNISALASASASSSVTEDEAPARLASVPTISHALKAGSESSAAKSAPSSSATYPSRGRRKRLAMRPAPQAPAAKPAKNTARTSACA